MACAAGRASMRDTHYIYLVPGFFGFANLGKLKYFAHVREFLMERSAAWKIMVKVVVVKTPPTSSLPKRAVRILESIAATCRSRHAAVHLIGHSSGGIDVRLVTAPSLSLPTDLDVERLIARVRTVVSVAAPHYGTPVASAFASLLGQKLLRVLSLSTIYLLRFGRLPLEALLQLGTIFARLDNLGLNSALLDEWFEVLLADFSIGRRRAVQALLAQVAEDQALLVQVTSAGMDLFNATVGNRAAVRYGSVVTCGARPGVGSTLAAGLDPSAQATLAVYRTLYRFAASTPPQRVPPLTAAQARILRHAYGKRPDARANDGLVPTRSQLWGDVIHAARADHLDVIGHFNDRSRTPPHFDWLATGSGFDREKFETLWADVLRYILASA